MIKNIRILYILTAVTGITLGSCKKYLDAKPDPKFATLNSLDDIQSLLDYYGIINYNVTNLAEIGADTYYMTTADWNANYSDNDKALYRWEKASLLNWGEKPWTKEYQAILYCNVALDRLGDISIGADDIPSRDNIKGSALYYRSFYYYMLSQLYTQPYDKATAATQLGLPLRSDPSYKSHTSRSNLKQTYDQILNDLKEAAALLPVTPLIKTRPGKPAVYGMLARTYLAMREYDSAGVYADKCLQLYNKLIDYNSLSAAASAPIPMMNDEIIFYARSASSFFGALSPSTAKIDSVLYAQYDNNDLRKSILFAPNTGANAGTYRFKGDYDGSGTSTGYIFAGIVTDEMYLTRAECYARAGILDKAMQDLNTLMAKRWKSGLFAPFTAADKNDAIAKILAERKKELVFRGTRWTDMRRLMNEPLFAVTPKRIINNQTYQLMPGSDRYTLLIPEDVIRLSGMQQNP